MPFQFERFPTSETPEDSKTVEEFLVHFTWPVNSVSGERLSWLDLPLVDKLWNSQRGDKGGFIQQATGWKPSILQPYVYLPALTSAMQVY